MKQFTDLKSEYAGKTMVLVANGPSLDDSPLGELAEKYPTFGMNRVHKMYPDFCPTFYACLGADQLMTPTQRNVHWPMINDDRLQYAFINRLFAHFMRHEKIFTALSSYIYKVTKVGKRFSTDPLNVIGLSATQAYPCLQIAHYLGFDTVLIVGMDGTYSGPDGMHWYDEDPLFPSGPGQYITDDNWQGACNEVYGIANRVFTKTGRRIINCSAHTVVDVFERGDVRDWL